jgi:hypothetical protein
MGRSPRHFLMIGWLLAVLPGCVEDFGRIHETDMPRLASEPRRFESFLPPSRTVDRFNARALWEGFGGNALQADLEYKGKNLQLTGIVRCIASDDRDRLYVGFQVFEPVKIPAGRLKMMSVKEKTWYQDGFPPLVICYLDSTDRSGPPNVKKGQTVQLTGRCLGRVKDPSGFKDYVVVLDSCRIREGDPLNSASAN